MDLRPTDVGSLREAVEGLRRDGRSAVVVGGGTLTHVADAGPSEVRLETTALGGVVAYEPADLTVTVGAGLTLAEADGVLATRGQTLPVWHPEPDRATLGGLVAFGWTGLGRRLYGTLRDRVLEVRAVTGEAKVVRGGGKVVKNVTGFDLPRLLCGSMGTLGVLYELTLKVHPRPRGLCGVRVEGDGLPDGVGAVPMPLEAILVRDASGWGGCAFAPGPREDAETLLAPLGGTWLDDADGTFRELATDPLLCGRGGEVVVRIAVPPEGVGDLPGRLAGVERAVVDVAGGVVWASLRDAGRVAALRGTAEAAGGSLVLLGARDDVRRDIGTWGAAPRGIELMRRLRASFDPDGVLGPGRFVV